MREVKRRARLALTATNGLIFSAGELSMEFDIRFNPNGDPVISLGSPYYAKITSRRVNGRQRFLIEAPEETRIERVTA